MVGRRRFSVDGRCSGGSRGTTHVVGTPGSVTCRRGLSKGLEELTQLGRTLWLRRDDVLAYFDVGVSNGPVEAINGRLEHLRGIALGFGNLNHYILRCLIHSGQLQNRINAL